MEMETDQSEAVQMETSVSQEDHVRKSKETKAHTVDGKTHLKQHGIENTQNIIIHNGELQSCPNRIR